MKIDSSNIRMESTRSYQKSTITYRRFSASKYQGSASGNLQTGVSLSDEELEETEDKDKKAENKTSPAQWQDRFPVQSRHKDLRSSTDRSIQKIRQQCIRYIFDMLFRGREERMPRAGKSSMGDWLLNNKDFQSVQVQEVTTMNLSVESWEKEWEHTSFESTGTVKLADGREISFQLEIAMSREFEQYYSEEIDLQSISFCDPLVINLDSNIASVSDQKFFFDIDADGELDEISMLSAASGYLALDKNKDGKIGDGSELFGTKSGNGFADLSAYDQDGNGWIDENDDVFHDLKIWSMNADGEAVLYSLSEKGVGAICLRNGATDFTLTGKNNETNGAIRNTGIFLYENGNVGTVQHVDMVKYNQNA
ncbi:hypothetical protein LJC58_02260 [Lachnospiraceae bacterium OttesenSCG-928-D06]|nr:hypothetical protein [Lachnospiraceae bacterium OttesenSCG-928-D06]